MHIRVMDIGSRADWRRFHNVERYIYRNDPLHIQPIETDIESIFSEKNAAFRNGPSRIWLLERPDGQPVGRISAFVDTERNRQQELPAGGIGFFECVNDPVIAKRLLETAETWLRQQDILAVDGPINFGERDRFWGLLRRGWYPPVYQENYHPPYYRAFFENNGYQEYEQILTLRGDIGHFNVDRLHRIAERVVRNYGFHCISVTRRNMKKSAAWFAQVYNAAFHERPYFKPLTAKDVYPAFRQMFPVFDPLLTCIAFDGERPVGMVAILPDLNKYFRRLNGRLRWHYIPWLLYRIHTYQESGCKGIAFGVDSEYQRLGVFPFMVDYLYYAKNEHNRRHHKYVDLSTIRGWNERMVKSCRSMGTEPHREHMAYRKALADNVEWTTLTQTDVSHVEMGEVPDDNIYPTA